MIKYVGSVDEVKAIRCVLKFVSKDPFRMNINFAYVFDSVLYATDGRCISMCALPKSNIPDGIYHVTPISKTWVFFSEASEMLLKENPLTKERLDSVSPSNISRVMKFLDKETASAVLNAIAGVLVNQKYIEKAAMNKHVDIYYSSENTAISPVIVDSGLMRTLIMPILEGERKEEKCDGLPVLMGTTKR